MSVRPRWISNPAFTLLLVLLIAGAGILFGCAALTAPALVPSQTPLPPTATFTSTPTVIWFPATATFTPFPTSPPAAPTEEMRPGLGEILLKDDFGLDAPWSTSQTAGSSVLLGDNELTIAVAKEKVYLYSVRQEPILSDFYVEITANPTFCQGLDEYGLLLRYSSPGDYYRFSASCDGQVRLDRVSRSQASSPQPWLLSGALPIGAPSKSRLAVWASGRELRFFVNDEFQFSINDPLLSQGQLGIFARATGDHLLTVSFSDLLVRQLNP